MKRIYKYNLEVGNNLIDIKGCEKILSVTMQGNEIVLYAVVNDKAETTEKYEVLVVGTGWELEDDVLLSTFLGTVPQLNGVYMWHVFYKKVK